MDTDTVAVVGAGQMGHGIAEVAALAGLDVRLRDVNEELVRSGYEDIEWSLDKLVENGQLDRATADAALERVTPLVDMEAAVADADVVVEAVKEEMEIKREVFGEFDRLAPADAVLATNTSSLSVTAIAEATDRPERVAGMHFFNPPVKMRLVEVIAGDHTAEATLDAVEALARTMDRTPVRVRKDTPGFVVNRVLAPMLNEAAWLVDTGESDLGTVDSTVKYAMGLPQGAFELADRVGLDVVVDSLAYMYEELGAAYEPCPLLVETVEAGDLGQKTGAGFYEYEAGGASVPADAAEESVARTLRAVMANEVAKLVGGGVADPPEIDQALELGAGFPEGPAAMADEAGMADLHDALVERRDTTGAERYRPAPELETRAEHGAGFHGADASDETGEDFETISVDTDDRVGRIIIDREHRMNTVTEETLDELVAAVETLEEDGARSVLLTGAGDRAFCAGADVQSAASSAEPRDAVELSRHGQRAFARLEESALPVVAGIEGYCLGGGMELAAACDLRVAGTNATFGQTEHSLGLMPGWGGTQRLPRIVGEGRAREVVLTADRYDADTMADYGFLTEVADDPEAAARELAADLADGPPVAQRYAKRAFLAGRDGGDAGYEVEAAAFGHLFSTDDLMEGVAAFTEDRDPEFEGE
jgi:enoyl-CoA hydratase/3-hydroxyacyl-CoA dehydrogenase